MAWLYEDAYQRHYKQIAFQSELIYQALIISMSSVLSQALGGSGEIPEKLGILEVITNNNFKKEFNSIKYFNKSVPDILDIF